MIRSMFFLLVLFTLLFLCSCQAKKTVCPPGSVTYFGTADMLPLDITAAPLPSTPSTIEIGGRDVTVDRIVEGPLCNDTWKGIIYVSCNIQVAAWTDEPTFLKDCNLVVEPDAVVYVAAHNNAAYYKGCSCHTGMGTPEP